MNYLKHYIKLVRNARYKCRSRADDTQYEGHHVKPRSLGGKFIVLLTPKEHYIAHFLLYKHYKKFGNKNAFIKMSRAFNAMTFSSNDNIERYTSKTFHIARLAFRKSMTGKNHPLFGKPVHRDIVNKIKNTMALKPEHEMILMRQRQSEARIGTKQTQFTKDKRADSLKLTASKKKPKYKVTLKCGTIVNIPGLNRFIIDYELSRSMILRSIDTGIICRGGAQSKINTQKVKNTVGIKIETIM
jgi:hypothetical protein